jgi:CRP/FNR family transcriptional regulator, cyclic AMP receptor protein
MDAATFFHDHCSDTGAGDTLHLPRWTVEDWRALLSHTEVVQVASGDALVRLGEQERALYFVVDGALEVSQSSGRSDTFGTLFRELPGSVFGEVSLFDGLPRSASVWAIKPTSLLRLSHEKFVAFTAEHMSLANDLLFALGRVLALRVRLAKARAQGRAFSQGG